ncbi:TonB-dependent receptor [Caulobacter sp. S45]|uniref:TonB-dependent receptor n=1 Tax=Caulobacter sp. S45 TaxID=1641861 RepID=UPI001576EE89|nr:TonB-dependent receptor [Caulobacter sp. S45]
MRAFLRITASTLAITTATLAGAGIALAQSAANPAPVPTGAEQSSSGTTGVAASQSTTAPGPAAPAAGGGANTTSGYTVDTVVVTAQKRKENLQDVPIVVTVVNKQLLQDSGVRDIKDLSKLTSGLTVTSTASEATTTARIRGVGTVGDNPGLEPSVGVVIDGVYRPRNGVGFNDLGDVDQIEVLKGPQGTLFGKSTSAGVISITTAEPSFKTGGSAEFTVGNYNEIGGSAEVHGALPVLGGDKVAGSFYFADRHRDGFYDVVTGQGPRTQDASDNEDFYTARGQLLFRPDSNLTARIIADYTHRDENCCAAVVKANSGPLNAASPLNVQGIVAGLAGAGGGEAQTPDPYSRLAYQNEPSVQNIVDEGISAQIDYKLPSINAAITSITAFRNWKLIDGNDLDFSNADLFSTPVGDENSTQFQDLSQELRFAGTYGKLDYLVGAFYANEYLRDNFEFRTGNQFGAYLDDLFSTIVEGQPTPGFLPGLFGPQATFPGGNASMDRYRQRDDDYSVFTNDTYHFTSKFDVNVGVRYTIDNKVLNSSNQNTGANPGAGCQAIDSSPLTQLGLIPQALLNTVCLPFFSPAFDNFSNHQSESTSNTSGTVKAVYRWAPELLTYVSYAKGFKAGGFNLDRVGCPNGQPYAGTGPVPAGSCPVATVPTNPFGTGGTKIITALTADTNTFFKPEYSDSIEAGAKTTLFDRKLLLNATLFYEKFSNFQYNTFNGLVFVVDSLPAVYSKGLDTDFLWRPIRDLNVQGGLTIASTRFSHTDGDATSGVLATSGFLGAAGSRLPLAPQYSASLEGTYTYRLPADYMVRLNLGTKFNSKYNTGSDEDIRKEQGAYFVTDGRIIFGPQDGKYDVEFWVENLANTHYEQVAFDSGFQNAPTNATGLIDAFLGNPRTFGATLRAKF